MGESETNGMTRRKVLMAAAGAVAVGTSAHAREPEGPPLLGSSGLLPPEVEIKAEKVRRSEIREAERVVGTMHSASFVVGPRGGDFIAKCIGWSFGAPYPGQVLLQARQNSDQKCARGEPRPIADRTRSRGLMTTASIWPRVS